MQNELDKLDKQILTLLLNDAKRAYADIASELFVSSGTIHVRVKKMERLGVINGACLSINYEKLGYDVFVFVGIFLEKSSLYKDVIDQLSKIPEVISAHYTTGTYSIFAQILCRDTNHLREVLHDKLQSISGIQRTETFLSLEQSIDRNPVIS